MGFEIERFIGDVDKEFICPICSEVLEDPLQATDCEHAFCRACITEWISRQPTCPVDRQPVTTSQLRPAPRFMRNVLSRLSTSCDFAPHGCNAVLQLESLASHLAECELNPKRPVPCEAGCGFVIPKDELADHNCVRELQALIAKHQEKLNVYEQELTENKRVHQEKLNDYNRELAENKRVHQEKLNIYKQALAENKRVHQEDLNDYKRELAENKRAHQEKLNDYEQELAVLKRELAKLKKFEQERLLNATAVGAVIDQMRGAGTPLPAKRSPPADQINPSTSALADEREREEVVRWSNTLERAHVHTWYANFPVPGFYLRMNIRGSLLGSGCPPHIIDDLMKNCFPDRWPPSIRTYRNVRLIMAEANILRWLEDADSDSENHLSVPELPNEDCSDVEDVPIDYVIDGECQSDSEIEGDEAEFQPIETETNTQPITEDSSSDDDVPLSRHRNFFANAYIINKMNQAQPKISRLVFMKQMAEDLARTSSGTPRAHFKFAKGSSVQHSSNPKNRTNARHIII